MALLVVMLLTIAVAIPASAATPLFKSTSTNAADAVASLTVDKPSGVVEGDLLLAQISFTGGNTISVSAPEGWTQVRRSNNQAILGQILFSKFATASEPASYAWQFGLGGNPASVSVSGGILAYSGVVAFSDDVLTLWSNGNSSGGELGTSLNAASLTLLPVSEATVIALYGITGNTNLSTPANMTERYLVNTVSTVSIKTADQDWVGVGAGPTWATSNRVSIADVGGQWIAQLVALYYETAPVLSLPADIVTEATGPDGATVDFTATATDVVDGAVPVTCNPVSGSVFPLGETTVNCSAVNSGGTETQGSFKVTVTDTTAPVLTLPADIVTEATSLDGATVEFTATATDIVDGAVPVTCVPPSGSVFPLGETTVNCSAVDAAGNPAQGSFKVTVTDPTAPILSLPADIVAEATGSGGATVEFTATATDIVDGAVPVTCAPPSGSVFPLGETTVNCSAVNSGGKETQGSFKVTVVDTTAPALSLPADIVTASTGPGGATVEFTATATDIVDGAVPVTCAPTSGSVFPAGESTVNCSAVDAAGNQAQGSFKVTVTDTTAPVLSLPADIVTEATGPGGATVEFTATATDVVDGAVPVTCAPPSGSVFPLGETAVNCSAVDAASNQAQGSFKVTVVDTTAPALNLPANIVAEATGPGGATVAFTATATDVVDGSVPATCAPTSGSVFPLGETTVNCSAGDAAGNPAQGSFKVTVVDTTAPALNLPANMTAPATGPDGATVSFTATATDLVDGSVPVTCVPASGSVFPAGETTVNCTAVDGAGNPAQGSFKVTVTDAAAPVLNLPDDIAVETDNPDGVEVEFTATATDAVDGAVPVTCVPASGSVFPVGETTVNCSAVNSAGKQTQGSFKVTVELTTDPTGEDPNGVYLPLLISLD